MGQFKYDFNLKDLENLNYILEVAIREIKQGSYSRLPVYLSPEEVERVELIRLDLVEKLLNTKTDG